MKPRNTVAGAVSLALLMCLATASPGAAQVSAEEARAIGVDAYLYFYPLVTMDLTRRQLTNVEPGKGGLGGPPNTFVNIPEYPSADMKVVVRPNFDTLYSSAWLDLTEEPDDRLGARHERALLPAADARHVDERVRVAGLADHGHAGGRLRHHSARLASWAIQAPRRRSGDLRPHALRLDHRPHQDRRPAGLRGRAQDPGGLQDHAAVALGQGARAGRGQDRSERRHEDAAEDPGRPDAGGEVFRLRGRAHEAAPAAHHGSADHRAAAADRLPARRELRSRQGRSDREAGARECAARKRRS